MDITSFAYLFFIVASLLIYWCMPKKGQWIVLLVDSFIFYFLNAKAYTIIYLFLSVITVWLATNYFKISSNEKKKRIILIFTLVFNASILAILKYTNLFINTFNFFGEKAGKIYIKPVLWAAPLAISFYTLQIIAYLLDAFWGVGEIEKNPFRLLLFTSFFPLMVSGPIHSYAKIGHQMFEEHRFDYDRTVHGMKRIAWGMLKKLAISNRIGIIVDFLWNNPYYTGFWVWIAAVGYAFQLYTDFSGCMDIVIGVSECFGIELTENFNAPLLSKNIQEFWRRWHITLGQWLRDYIMNPILKSKLLLYIGDKSKSKFGKRKGKKVPVFIAMFVLWSAMGLWHGNSWKYIVGEGWWYWLVIVLSQIFEDSFKKLYDFLHIKNGLIWKSFQVIRTNLIFAVGMLFFRAESLVEAFDLIKKSFYLKNSVHRIGEFFFSVAKSLHSMGCIILLISFIAMFIYDICIYNGKDVMQWIKNRHFIVRWAIYIFVCFLILSSYNIGSQSFAYAQF